MRLLKRAFTAVALLAALLIIIFLVGRYGWKLGGFNACQGAWLETVEVGQGTVHIRGGYPGSFPSGFCGYYAREQEGTLYVGFHFSSVFGFFETGDFDITIPVKTEINRVILKTGDHEVPVWSREQETDPIPDAYAPILDEYYTALSGGWDAARMMENGLNYMAADSIFTEPLEDIGYAIADLDGDGIQELAIGARKDDPFFGKLVFSLYILDENGAPQLLLDSSERNRYYYAGGFCFANQGSSGWNDSFDTTLKLEDGELIDMTYTTEPENFVQMELTPFAQWK